MKFGRLYVAATVVALSACAGVKSEYADYVNPFIGTGGHGHTFPGATVPYGMIQPSPDTRIFEWDSCSGYYYPDSTINGFSHTHLSGTGCCDYGDVLLMPTVGKQEYHSMGSQSQQMAYASSFSHNNEKAEPGYYSVFLDRYKVMAELTATKRAAIHRYTFPASKDAGFILDFDYSLQRQTNKEMTLEVISDTEIRGRKKTMYWAFDQYINFYIKFSKPFTYTMVTDSMPLDKGGRLLPTAKVLLHFNTSKDEVVYAKIGISAVDMAGAQKNLEAEIPAWDFDGVKATARAMWNDYLSKVDVKADDNDKKTIFYSALYHTAISPNLFSDVDGRYLGMDLKVRQSNANDPMYTVFSLWDTFRAFHPLKTIIDPEINQAFIRSLIQKYKEEGVFPMWELGGNETGEMLGYHAVSVITDSYVKGYRNFDAKVALKAGVRTAEYDTSNINCPRLVLPRLMPQAKYWKNKVGYVPCDKDNESVAKALEYAYNDWCISVLADSLGDKEVHSKYSKLAEGYKHYFDPSIRFMRGKDSQGSWRTPFNPAASNHRNDDYCEGNAWQWTWFVPHHVDGLVQLMGGKDAFAGKLDSLFAAKSKIEGHAVSADISGLIGQYAHGNEPSHHITHLYNYVGQPWKTQALADSVMQSLYFNAPNGLAGNEDCGQMSSWYILNSIGFYQVCPGKPVYSIGRPLFRNVTINLGNGRKFSVVTKNNSRQNKYIQSVTLNGRPLSQPFFSHADLVAGGTLEVTMGSQPSYQTFK